MTRPPPDEFDDGAWRPPANDEATAADAWVVQLAGFEGPLDLLLALARTQKVDLRAISVAALAAQYVAMIRAAQSMRIDVAADHLVMAAWLAFLKSRLLLPQPPATDATQSAEVMAARLRFRLARLDAMRSAAAQLLARKRLGLDVFARGAPETPRTNRTRTHAASLYDLLKAYADLRTRGLVKRSHVVARRQVWSIKEARAHLDRLIGATVAGDWVQLDLFLDQVLGVSHREAARSRTALAASFGASLEMARDGIVDLQQAAPFAPLYLRRRR
jgi:segregation and condensation protein A